MLNCHSLTVNNILYCCHMDGIVVDMANCLDFVLMLSEPLTL